MDTDKKKPTLREAYDAARKGEAYMRKLAEAKQTVDVIWAKVVFWGGVAVLVSLFIMKPLLPDDVSLMVTLVAALAMLTAMCAVIAVMWRMLRGNIVEKMYEDVDNEPADPDGVKRTQEERGFLASPFGTAATLLYDTAKLVQHANANYYGVARTVSSTDDPIIVDVGNTLSRVSDRFGKLEVLLETRWNECPPSVRDAPFTRDCLRDICQQLTVINIQTIDCYSFIYRYLP